MTGNKCRFTSDRRAPSNSSWADDPDWASGVGENVDVIDGGLVGRAPDRGSILPDGRISKWAFEDDLTPNTATDSWGNNSGSISGASITNGSLIINERGDYVSIPDDPTLHPAEMTVAAWVNIPQADTNSKRAITDSEHTGNKKGWRIQLNRNDEVEFRWKGSVFHSEPIGDQFSYGTAQFLGMTYDTNADTAAYIGTTQVGGDTNMYSGALTHTARDIYISSWAFNPPSAGLPAGSEVACVAYYDRALSPSEMFDLATSIR